MGWGIELHLAVFAADHNRRMAQKVTFSLAQQASAGVVPPEKAPSTPPVAGTFSHCLKIPPCHCSPGLWFRPQPRFARHCLANRIASAP